MKARILIATFVILLVVLIAAPIFSVLMTENEGVRGSLITTKQVALALKLYASDHNGTLPLSLEALVPTYFEDPHLLSRVHLVTPGAMIDKIPSNTIIVRFLSENAKDQVAVRADMSSRVTRQ